jgi:tetratricopeptide (TPR) repeat protein
VTTSQGSSLINKEAQIKLIEGTRAANEKNFAMARKAYQDATKLDSRSAGPFVALGELELALGDLPAAERALEEAVRRVPHWSVELFRAKVQSAKGDFGAAEKTLKDAIAKNSEEPVLNVVLGDLYINRMRLPAEAKAAYQRAIALNPNLAAAHYALGVSLQMQGDAHGARRAYTQAKALAPEIVLSGWALARLDLAAGKPDAAIEELSAALKRNPRFHQAHLDLGDAYSAKGDNTQAMVSYRAYVKAQPQDALGHQKIAMAHHAAGKLSKAVDAYRTTIGLDKDAALSLNNLGFLLAQQKKELPEAERHAKRAIELAPNEGAFVATLGWVYRAQGKAAEAEAQLRKAMQLTSPESAEQNAMLATLLADQGKLADARIAAQRALALDAKNAMAADLLKKLK